MILLMDGRIPIQVDEEEFEIIKLMVAEVQAENDPTMRMLVARELMRQGYRRLQAIELCVLACAAVRQGV